jgi:hypothetical protein
MFLVKIILRLWLIGVQFGLWGDRAQLLGMQHSRHANRTAAAQANSAAAAPVIGIAARQGRRFSMEDRAVYETAVLAPGRGCAAVNYTYAAGERGSCHSLGPARLRLIALHGICVICMYQQLPLQLAAYHEKMTPLGHVACPACCFACSSPDEGVGLCAVQHYAVLKMRRCA